MESFLWLHWCVWPVLRLLTNSISSFNTTMIFCFVLLIPQPKVLDYAKIFVVFLNFTVWLLPPPPPPPLQFQAGWNFAFHWFQKYTYIVSSFSHLHVHEFANISDKKKLWREQIPWLGGGKRLIGYKNQICMCFKNIQIYVARD